MNRRDIRHRLAGVAVLLGAGASTWLHRDAWLAHASGAATGVEAALGLLTFVLASLGVLLVIGGARFRDGWKRDCAQAARHRERRIEPDHGPFDAEAENRRIMMAAVDSMIFAGGRAPIATLLVMRARQAGLDARLARETTPEKYEPGAQ